MKGFLLFLNILILYNAYANDAWVNSAGGSYAVLEDKNQNIKMVSERIRIDLYDNYYEMDIEFYFYNYGNTVELMVGFPEYSYGTGQITNIRNFQTSINNMNVEVEIVQNGNATAAINSGYRGIHLWYVKNVVFAAGKYTVSRVRYRADYAGHGPYKGVEYLYGTGGTWNDKIDQMVIEITNHSNYWLTSFFFRTEHRLTRINDQTIEIQVNDVSPNLDDTFSISFSNFPAFEYPHYAVTETRWRLNREIIPNEELTLLNSEQLRILRNSIYAYHGYEFRSADLRNYFSRQNWYRINNNFTENIFSENERTNLENIIREESRRN
jgi:hypothetical protein